jgi:hypothetical protein
MHAIFRQPSLMYDSLLMEMNLVKKKTESG